MSNILTRVLGSENLTARIGIGGEIVFNDFDSKYPFSDMQRIEDENGEIWIRVPKFYSYYETDGEGNITGRQLSQYKVDKLTWFLNPKFLDESGNELPYIDIAAYLCSIENNIVVTKSGATPLGGGTYSTTNIITRAANRNVGQSTYHYQLLDYWTWQLLQDLFTVEFANSDCHQIMEGYDVWRGRLVNGTCDSVTATSGKPANTGEQCAMKYRGIENLYGNGRLFIDGIRFVNNDIQLSNNGSTYYSISQNKIISAGTISKLGVNATYHFVFPKVIITNVAQTGAYKDSYNGESAVGIKALYSGGSLYAYYTNDNVDNGNWRNAYRLIRTPIFA